jgi:hypothetical protein
MDSSLNKFQFHRYFDLKQSKTTEIYLKPFETNYKRKQDGCLLNF